MNNGISPDVIRYVGDNRVLVARSEIEDFNTKSQLIVDESQEAIFYKDGNALDLFGPGRHPLNSDNLPILKRIFGAIFKKKTPFPCHVYFINKATVLTQIWGTDTPIQTQDPKFGILVHARGFGQYGIRVEDSRRFIVSIVGQLPEFSTEAIHKYIKGLLVSKAKIEIAKAIAGEKISYVDIAQYQEIIGAKTQEAINKDLEEYGLRVTNFYIESINIPDEDFALLRKKREEFAAGMAEVELEAERTKMLAKARAEARAAEGYTYQEEQKFDVLKTAAGNEGSAGNLMGVGMGLGMGAAVGNALGGSAAQTGGVMNETGGKKCPECGANIPPNAKFCPECGHKIPIARYCSNCGTKLAEGAKFCPECGTKAE